MNGHGERSRQLGSLKMTCLSFDNSKKQFKWHGDYKELKAYLFPLTEEGESALVAENDNGSCQVLKLKNVTFNFYGKTKTLQIQGSLKDEFSEKLRKSIPTNPLPIESSIVEVEEIVSDPDLDDDDDDSEDESDDSEVEQEKESCQCQCESTQRRLSVLEKHLHSIETKITSSPNLEDIQAKDQEISDLRLKICSLTKELNQVKMERDGLVAALGHMHSTAFPRFPAASVPGNVMFHNGGIFNETSIGSDNIDDNPNAEAVNSGKTRKINKSKQNANVLPSNKRTQETFHQPNKRTQETFHQPNKRTQETFHQPSNKPNDAKIIDSPRNNEAYTTVIVGDSIVKNVYGQKMGNNTKSRVVVKSFSGATTADMNHYIKPTMERNPDQVILHVGTNDLKTTDALKVAENIVDLARKIELNTNAKVTISQLITRRDLGEKVKAVNKHLKRFANQNDWGLIDHSNVTSEDLNKGGLHLNEKGTKKLYDNFVNLIRSH